MSVDHAQVLQALTNAKVIGPPTKGHPKKAPAKENVDPAKKMKKAKAEIIEITVDDYPIVSYIYTPHCCIIITSAQVATTTSKM